MLSLDSSALPGGAHGFDGFEVKAGFQQMVSRGHEQATRIPPLGTHNRIWRWCACLFGLCCGAGSVVECNAVFGFHHFKENLRARAALLVGNSCLGGGIGFDSRAAQRWPSARVSNRDVRCPNWVSGWCIDTSLVGLRSVALSGCSDCRVHLYGCLQGHGRLGRVLLWDWVPGVGCVVVAALAQAESNAACEILAWTVFLALDWCDAVPESVSAYPNNW